MIDTKKLPSPNDPKSALAAVVALRRLADRLERAAVRKAIEQGWTWALVAESLGVTRQAAHKKHALNITNDANETEGDAADVGTAQTAHS